MSAAARPPRSLLLAAYAAIYLVWGSSFLALRFAVETVPGFAMGAFRFLIAGVLLLGVLRARGVSFPDRRAVLQNVLLGVLLVFVASGSSVYAADKIASGLSALIWSSAALWIVVLQWAFERDNRPSRRAMIGTVIGFGGLLVMLRPGGAEGLQPTSQTLAIAFVLAASLGWSVASMWTRRHRTNGSPLMSVAIQMIVGGALLALTSVLRGEHAFAHLASVSTKSALALGYLTLADSLVTLSAYVWLLTVANPTSVASYAYVNPLLAVTLGIAFAHESLSSSTLVGGLVVLFSVALTLIDPSPAANEAVASTAPAP